MTAPVLDPPRDAAQLAALLSAVVGVDVGSTSIDGLVELVGRAERLRSWLAARRDAALVELQRREPPDVRDGLHAGRGGHQRHAELVGVRVGWSTGTVRAYMSEAVLSAEQLPRAAAALSAGTITEAHLRALAQAVRTSDPAVMTAVDEQVFGAGARTWLTPAQLARGARRAAIATSPAAAAARHRRAVAEREVRLTPTDDGMAVLRAVVTAADAQTLAAAIEARARSPLSGLNGRHLHDTPTAVPGAGSPAAGSPAAGAPAGGSPAAGSPAAGAPAGDPPAAAAGAAEPVWDGPDGRSLAQRRADALVAMAAADLDRPDAPAAHRHRPRVVVTVAWSTLIGADDAPADLSGYGPIDAATARRIAADPTATWRRLLVDPDTGAPVSHDRTQYTPPADLAAFVRARDQRCRHPLCERPATECDLDHRTRWTDDGITSADNLDALCRRHHRSKDEFGWQHRREAGSGDSIWTTPTGHTVRKPAEHPPRPPDLEPQRWANIGPPPY